MQGVNTIELCATREKTYPNNCKFVELGIINLKIVNILMTTGEIKIRHPCHDLTKTWRRGKSLCLVWIRPTDNYITHPRKRFTKNEHWPNKWNTQKSTIKKRLERRTWRILYIRQTNQLKWTKMNIQPEYSPRSSTNLQGKKICMSGLDTSHGKFSNTHVNNQWWKDEK